VGDIEAEKAIQRAIASNDNTPWMALVDPNPLLMARYGQLLPETPLRWYPDADRFLDSGFA
jgi:hypothetical protein